MSKKSLLSRRKFLNGVGNAGAVVAVERAFHFTESTYAQRLTRPGTADWPSFAWNIHNTRSNANEKTLGRDNVGRLKLRWSFRADGPIQTTPTVIGNTLFFGASSGHEYALDVPTGEKKWDNFVGFNPDPNASLQGVRSSSYYEDGKVYFGDAFTKVRCVDAATGEEIWGTVLDDKVRGNRAQIFSSPLVSRGRVFIGTSSGHAQAACLDAETGAIRWRFYVVPTSEVGAGSIWTSGALDEEQNVIFFGTGSNKTFYPPGPMLYTESLIALDADTGELVWFDQPRPASPYDFDHGCHPIIFDAQAGSGRGGVRRCIASIDKAGINCYERFTGEILWKKQITKPPGPRLNSVAFANNKMFMVSNATGVQGRQAMSVTVALHAFTGDILWWVPNSAVIQGPVAHANGVFYQGLQNGSLEAIDADTGEELWKYQLPSMLRGGIAIANGVLYASNGASLRWKPDPTKVYSMMAFSIDGQ